VAVFFGYGSHLLADMMTLGGVQFFWPSRLIAVFPGRDEYRVVSGSRSETVFVAVVFVLAFLFYPVSSVGFDGLIYRMGGSDQVYGEVTKVTEDCALLRHLITEITLLPELACTGTCQAALRSKHNCASARWRTRLVLRGCSARRGR
jgi:hypothetical protein